MSKPVVEINSVKKKYRLGVIGGSTLTADIQSKWAKLRRKEDPNSKIGTDTSKYGEDFWALKGINLKVNAGEAVGIIGSNGAGKSTLLKLLCRVTAPTEGTIKINGRIASMLEVGTGFHPELTGRENIYMNGAILGMTRKEVDSKIEDIIDFSECREFIDTPVKRYSSGMYVKLAFAVAAHLDAEILIMDEVLAVGDVKFQKKCLGKMGDAAENEGKTVLYVSHNMSTIRQLCTRCIVLSHGTIIYDGDVEEAIRIYAEEDRESLKTVYELKDCKRPSANHGKDLVIDSLSFEDVALPIYSNTDTIKMKMVFTSKKKYDGLGLYFVITSLDGTIVGTTQTCDIKEVESDKEQTVEFSFVPQNFIDGDYYFYPDIFFFNEFGNFWSVDHPVQKVFFKIKNPPVSNTEIRWIRSWFGSNKLPDITIDSQK